MTDGVCDGQHVFPHGPARLADTNGVADGGWIFPFIRKPLTR